MQCHSEPLNLFQTEYDTDNAPIKLSYHNSNHYNSVRDLNNPSVGVGLGLPGYDPSEPDKQQVRQAVAESEAGALEDEIIQHSIRQSEEDDITNAMVQAQERQLELESAEAEIERVRFSSLIRSEYVAYMRYRRSWSNR
jgi:OTU domain-containing protein 5